MKALVVLSGGQDSTFCLYWAKNQGFKEIHAVTFDYGQRHGIEIEAAKKVASDFGVLSHEIVELGEGILKSTSPLVSDQELEQYSDYKSLPGGLEKTFVPMRNQLFLTVAANRAYALGITNLITGVCQEDSGGYPDCRKTFIDALQRAANYGTFTGKDGALDGLTIFTPLIYLTKSDLVKIAMKVPGAYEAWANSHTSYDGQYPPVGKDHATLLREKGFAEAGIPDPLILRAFSEDLMSLPETSNYDFVRQAVENAEESLTLNELIKVAREGAEA